MPETHSVRGRIRALNRLRWLAKWRLLQDSRLSGASCSFFEMTRYIFIDPEVHTFSYPFRPNPHDLRELALLTGATTDEVAQFSAELPSTRLRDHIRAATKWRLESKREPALGRHTLAYIAVRARKPGAVLELGVHHGLGSAVLLDALKRNASEGSPGTLHSVDLNPANGWIARGFYDSAWVLHRGHSVEVLSRLSGVSNVGVVILDTTWDATVTKQELALAMRLAQSDLLVLHNAEWNAVVRDHVEAGGGCIVQVIERPSSGWPPGRTVDFARFLHRTS